MVRWTWANRGAGMLGLLIPLTMLIPTLYGSSHMRYLLPLIPLLLLWITNPKITIPQENLAK